jgi:hypothetical protein
MVLIQCTSGASWTELSAKAVKSVRDALSLIITSETQVQCKATAFALKQGGASDRQSSFPG